MKKRRSYRIPLALFFFVILGANVWVFNSTARTGTDKSLIEHTQVEFFVPGNRILLQTNISDPSGIAEARLYFGTTKHTKDLVFTKMKSQTGDSYVGVIPAPSSETEKIYYCFLAVNYNGDVIKTGLFELSSARDVGFVPTWQGELSEYGKTLSVGKEYTLDDTEETLSVGLEGFDDAVTVIVVEPEAKYYAAKKVEKIPGLATIDGGDVEPAEGEGKPEGEGWTRNQKIAAGAGGAVALGIGIGFGVGGGGGGGGNGCSSVTLSCGAEVAAVEHTYNVTAPDGVDWTAETGEDWISFISDTGTGNGTVIYAVEPNPDPSRNGRIDVKRDDNGGLLQCLSIMQESCEGCEESDFSIPPPSNDDVPCEGLSDCFDVITDSTCKWTAESCDSWIMVTLGSGTGNGEVCYTVAQNQSANERTGCIKVKNEGDKVVATFTITQEGCCLPTLQPTSDPNVPCEGKDEDCFDVMVNAGCGWNASSNCDWVNIKSGGSGSGNGSVCYEVEVNAPGSPARDCEITVTGDVPATFTINQEGCPEPPHVDDAEVSKDGINGSIKFNPNSGDPGQKVSVEITLNNVPDIGDGWQVKFNLGGESKKFNDCTKFNDTFNCNFTNLFKFTESGSTKTLKIILNLDAQGKTRIYKADVPLEFK